MTKFLMTKSEKRKFILLSKKYNSILWLPPRTGSNHCWSIMKDFDFKRYEITKTKVYEFGVTDGGTHDHELIDGHENHILIQTIRNPYSMLASLFKLSNTVGIDTKNKNHLYDYIYHYIHDTKSISDFTYKIRKPDYRIRLENLFEDYSTLPFIKESNLYKSGELEFRCKIPINKNIYNFIDWRDLYTQESADLVYYSFINVFDEMDYDKNSWKK